MDAEEGTEWNFSYVLPQNPGNLCHLVIPTSLQMGSRDVAQDYCETELGTLPPHKFTHYVTGNHAYAELPETDPTGQQAGHSDICSRCT
jgi:hypothetical protein